MHKVQQGRLRGYVDIIAQIYVEDIVAGPEGSHLTRPALNRMSSCVTPCGLLRAARQRGRRCLASDIAFKSVFLAPYVLCFYHKALDLPPPSRLFVNGCCMFRFSQDGSM